jgi:hypothetical protein
MRTLLLLLAVGLLPTGALAAADAADCSRARDPERCTARQAAIKACADARGPEKRACLDAALPPPDCSRATDRSRCEAVQKARDACKDKRGKALKACLAGEKHGAKKRRKPTPNKPG